MGCSFYAPFGFDQGRPFDYRFGFTLFRSASAQGARRVVEGHGVNPFGICSKSNRVEREEIPDLVYGTRTAAV